MVLVGKLFIVRDAYLLERAAPDEDVPVPSPPIDVRVCPDPVQSIALPPGEGNLGPNSVPVSLFALCDAHLEHQPLPAVEVGEHLDALADHLVPRDRAEDGLGAVEAG